MLIPVLGGLQVRVRDMPFQYIIAYLSLMVYGALNFAGPNGGGVGLNEFLVNIIGLFFTTNLCCLLEYTTGRSSIASTIPTLLVLAPGSTAVKDVLLQMQIGAGVYGASNDSDTVTFLWLLGVSYSLGIHLAMSYWKPFLMKRSVAKDFIEEAVDRMQGFQMEKKL